ncbi:MAG: fibronectin type III domain-containing protein [Chitinophagales bacterium]|nr:fibronectin type III domain-containing protein [Chitinophagales bacterium]
MEQELLLNPCYSGYYGEAEDYTVNVLPTGACLPPTNLLASAITTSSATMDWDASTSNPSLGYVYELRTSGAGGSGATGLVSSGTTTSLTTDFTSLNANTTYNFYIRSVCSASDSSVWNNKSFKTACGTATLPYLEDFESATPPSMPSCTSTENAGTGNNWTTVNNPGYGFTNKCLYYQYNSSAANAWFYTNGVPLTAGESYRLKFDYGNNVTSTWTEKLQVMYGTSPDYLSMSDQVIDLPSIQTGAKRDTSVDFTATSTGIFYFGFNVYSAANQYYLYVDNISITVTPTCDAPINVQVANITSSDADISWDAPLIGTPTSYSIYYSTTNTPPTLTQAPTKSGISLTTETLTGLTPSTNYYLWVRSVCSATDSSEWSNMITFKTECVPVTSLPWTEGFEGVATPGVGILPNCWDKELISGTGLGTSNANDTYRAPRTGTKYMYTQWSTTGWAYTPGFQLSAGTSYDFSFYMMNKQGSAGFTMDVAYGSSATEADMVNVLETGYAATNTTYQQFKYTFTPPADGVYYFGIKSTSPTATPWYLSFDDFTLEVSPTCGDPTNVAAGSITTTSADISWDAPLNGTPTSYSIFYSTSNTTPPITQAPSIAGIAGTSTTITGLTPATQYYVWVRSVCSATDSSSWSSQKGFVTSCNPSNVPYLQDFETATVPGMPTCTSAENAGTGNSWVTVNNPGYGFTSKVLYYAYSSSSAANAWFYTNGIQLTAGTSYRLKFDYGSNSTSYNEKLQVMTGASPDYTAMTEQIIDLPSIKNNIKKDTTVDFVASASGVYYFGFNVYSDANQYYLYVDNISIDLTPTCSEPTNIVASNVTTNSVDLDWDAPVMGTPTSYSIYYSTSNTPPSFTEAPTVSGISSTTYSLSGLSPATQYYVWVRSVCSATDSSSWSNIATFATVCAPITTLPWTEGFEGVATPGVGILPNCWDKELISGTGLGTSNANDTYRAPRTGTKYMYTQWSTTGWAYTPGFQLSAGTSYDFSFYMMNKQGSAGFTMDVAYGSSATEADMVNVLETGYAATNTTYQQFKYTFTPPADGVYYFGIKSTSPTATPWYLSFDDFTLEVSPTCGDPTNVAAGSITTTSADISWDAPLNGTPTSYSLYYSTSNTTPDFTQAPTVSGISGTTYSLTGLNPSTQYYVWVRSICSATDSSSWSNLVGFATSCATITSLPWTEGFEGVAVPAQGTLPNCWDKELISGTGIGTSTANDTYRAPRTGTKYMYTQYGTTAWAFTPGFQLYAGTSYDFSFYMMNKNGTAGFTMDVAYGAGQTAADMTNVLETGYAANNTSYQKFSYTFTPPTDGVYYFGVKSTETTISPWYLSFDDFTLELSAVPVTYTSFTGKKEGNTNILEWTTATETNNLGYELERSADGNHFSKLDFIASKAVNGNSNSVLTYSYIDNKPLVSNNYYRLKQMDKDGKVNYSNVILIKGDKSAQISITGVYPNPTRNTLNVNIYAPSSEKVSVVITDISGKVLAQQNLVLNTGNNTQQIDVSRLSQGTYLIKTICNNGCESAVTKFVKY